MYYRGKMFGFVHLYSGQEAVSTGIIRALRADDYICSTYRDHVHALSKGCSANEVGTPVPAHDRQESLVVETCHSDQEVCPHSIWLAFLLSFKVFRGV
jgi:TPP-dependent pyruvate/acetoin dehydrogenase alpha subunit